MDNVKEAAVYVAGGLVAVGLLAASVHFRKKLAQRKKKANVTPTEPVAYIDNVVDMEEVRNQKTGQDRFHERYGNIRYTAQKP